MGLGGGAPLSKYILIAVNTIFLLLGLGIGIAGVVFRFTTDLLKTNALKEILVNGLDGEDIFGMFNFLSLFFIIMGFVIFIVGGLGCCGAFCSNRVLLVLYAIIVLLLLIAQIAAVAWFVGLTSSFDGALKTSFKKALNITYNGNNDALKNSFSALFHTYECCGVEKYTDMPNAPTLPVACCPVIKNTVACTEEKAYPTGCSTKLKEKIEEYSNASIGVGIAVLVFQLLCLIFAFCFCINIEMESVV